MTLQALAQIGGVIGVIASLIYVAIQISNNARAVRASAYQQLAANTSTHWSVLAQNGDLTDIVLRGTDDFHTLSRLEKARFRFNTMANLRQYENAWFQHNIGTLKEDDWVAIAADMDSFSPTPGSHRVAAGPKPVKRQISPMSLRLWSATQLLPASRRRARLRQFQARACHSKGVTYPKFSGYAPGPSR